MLFRSEVRVVQTTPVDEALREELRTIRRDVHTIKGASAVIGISEIAEYAHKVEDFLDWLFDKAPAIDKSSGIIRRYNSS